MQAQGIMPSVSDNLPITASSKSDRKNNAVSDDFGKIMDRQSENFGKKDKPVSGKINDSKPTTTVKDDSNVVSLKETPKAEENKIPDLSEAEEEVVDLLSDVTGLSEEDIVDIMEQLGIYPIDFLLSEGTVPNEYTLLDMETVKDFVMEVYGITDDTAFLTNDVLTSAFDKLNTGLQELVSELFMEESGDSIVLNEETLESLFHIRDNLDDEKVQAPSVSEDKEMVMEFEVHTADVSADTADSSMEQSDSGNFFSQADISSEDKSKSFGVTTDRPAEANENQPMQQSFVEHLNDAVREVNTDATKPAETMNQIVTQIVNHVRVRMLPQSTSMELMLNPASLGRVLLSVSTVKGVSTATMTVQNEMAKEAIENQMITLQQTFEEKGIKVTSIEVNVSEFGFKKDGDTSSERDSSGQTGKRNRNRRFRMEDEIVTNQEEELQSGDSLIDYTA